MPFERNHEDASAASNINERGGDSAVTVREHMKIPVWLSLEYSCDSGIATCSDYLISRRIQLHGSRSKECKCVTLNTFSSETKLDLRSIQRLS